MALDISPKLRLIAKQLDPSRPVNTADGDWTPPANETSGLVEFDSAAIFPWNTIPITMPNWPVVVGTPKLPVIVHEMGNFVSWPLLRDQISRFRDNIKPYWLTPPLAAVAKAGLLGENEVWSARSNRLYLFCWKDQIEAIRKSEKISGNEWWLLQDFWTSGNGILDTYYVSKHSESELNEIRGFNSAVQILIAEAGDSLPMPANESRLQRAYSSNDTLATSLYVSNYGANTIVGAVISWSVVASGPGVTNMTVCQHSGPMPPVPQGPGLTAVASIVCPLPDLGSGAPRTLTIDAQLHEGATATTAFLKNTWRSRIYAVVQDAPSPKGLVYTQAKFCDYLPVTNLQCSLPGLNETILAGSVFVVDFLDSTMLQWAARGMTVVVNANATSAAGAQGPAGIPLATDRAVFKAATWLGSADDSMMGTVAYPILDTIAPGMAPDGWADECWHRLIHGGRNQLLDEPPFAGNVDVVLRSIDLATFTREKALLWQAGVVSDVPEPAVTVIAKCDVADSTQQWSLEQPAGGAGALLVRHNSSGRCLSFQGAILGGQRDVGLQPCDEASHWYFNRSGIHQTYEPLQCRCSCVEAIVTHK